MDVRILETDRTLHSGQPGYPLLSSVAVSSIRSDRRTAVRHRGPFISSASFAIGHPAKPAPLTLRPSVNPQAFPPLAPESGLPSWNSRQSITFLVNFPSSSTTRHTQALSQAVLERPSSWPPLRSSTTFIVILESRIRIPFSTWPSPRSTKLQRNAFRSPISLLPRPAQSLSLRRSDCTSIRSLAILRTIHSTLSTLICWISQSHSRTQRPYQRI